MGRSYKSKDADPSIDAYAHCVIEHPLQPFSPQAFGAGDARRFSYRGEWRAAANDASLEAEPAFLDAAIAESDDAEDPALPDRDALQQFFRNPARAFLRDRLGLWLPSADDDDPDLEPLGADGLVRYLAAEKLLEHPHWTLRELRARGLLPPGKEGAAVAGDAGAIAGVVATLRDAARGTGTATVVESRDGIAFRFDDVVDRARVIAAPGKLDGKRRLRAGIDHLLLASVLGGDARTTLVGYERDRHGEIEPVDRVYAGVDAAAARAALQALLALWHEGRRQPLPFTPKCAAAYVDALRKHGDAHAAWRTTASTAFQPFGLANRDCDDPWLQLAFRPDGLFASFDAPCAVRFREVAQQVFDALEPQA